MKTKTIYTMRMAQHLINRGFIPLAQVPNAKDISKTVWLFAESEDFNQACAEYVASSKQHKEAGRPKIPPLSGRVLANMHLEQGLTIEDVAKITGYSENHIRDAVKNQKQLRSLFAFAAMTYNERQEYMDAQTDSEREQLVNNRLRRGGFFVYGGRDSYNFPANAETGEVSNHA